MGFISTAGLRLPRGSRAGIALAALFVVLLAPATSQAQTYTWNQPTSGGTWATATNWLPTSGTPNGASAIAIFGNVATGANTVSLPVGGVTIGELRFEDVNAGSLSAAYTIAAGQPITFNNGAAASQLNVTGFTRTNQTINAAIVIGGSQPLNITNNGAPGLTTLTIGTGGISATTAGTALNIDGAANTTISGIIGASVGTLTKNGSGTLTLGGVNGYTGGTVISGGTVVISADNNLGAAAGGVTLDGGALRISGIVSTFGTSRSFTLGANGGTIYTEAGAAAFSPSINSAIGGSGSLTLDGGGYLTLTGNNTYTGGTILNDVGLRLANGGRLSGTSPLTINGFINGRIGLILLENNNSGGAVNNRLNGAPITLNGGLFSFIPNVTGAVSETTGDVTVRGFGTVFANQVAGGLGTGQIIFNRINRLDGFSTLYMGGPIGGVNITVANDLPVSTGSGTEIGIVPWIGGDSGGDGSGTAGPSASGFADTLYTNSFTNGLVALDARLSVNFAQIAVGSPLEADVHNALSGNPAVMTGDLTVRSIVLNPANSVSGTSTISGTGILTVTTGAIANIRGLLFNGPTLDFGSNTAYLYLGSSITIQTLSSITGSGGVVVTSNSTDGRNTLNLNNATNAFTGGLYLNGTSRVQFALGDAQLGAAGEVISFRGGQLRYTGAGSVTLSTSGSPRPLQMTAAGGGGIAVTSGTGILTVPGLISGPEQMTKLGGGTLVLSNTANTYTGGTTIGEGTLAIAGGGSLGTGDLTLGFQGTGGTLRFDSPTTITAKVNHAFASTLNTNGNNVTLSGVVSGNGATLTKTGTGTLTLSAANTYTANTSVSAGTLLVTNTTGSGTGYGTVSVTNGAAIGGTGTIGGSVAINNAASKLIVGTPGGTGTLTLRGRTNTFAATSVFQTHLAGTTEGTGYAQLVITSGGAIALTNATLNATLGYTPSPSDKIFLIDNRNATGGLTGTFATLAQGATYTFANGTTAVISYTGDFGTGALTGGNDVVLHTFVPVPEPTTVLGIGAVALGGLMWRRRRGTATLAV